MSFLLWKETNKQRTFIQPWEWRQQRRPQHFIDSLVTDKFQTAHWDPKREICFCHVYRGKPECVKLQNRLPSFPYMMQLTASPFFLLFPLPFSLRKRSVKGQNRDFAGTKGKYRKKEIDRYDRIGGDFLPGGAASQNLIRSFTRGRCRGPGDDREACFVRGPFVPPKMDSLPSTRRGCTEKARKRLGLVLSCSTVLFNAVVCSVVCCAVMCSVVWCAVLC